MAKEKNIKDMTIEELESKLVDYNESLFNFRFQKINGQLTSPSKINETKKTIARLKTFIERKINA